MVQKNFTGRGQNLKQILLQNLFQTTRSNITQFQNDTKYPTLVLKLLFPTTSFISIIHRSTNHHKQNGPYLHITARHQCSAASPSVRQKCPALSSVCAVRCENVPPQNIKNHATSASVTDNEGIQYYIVKIVNVQFCCYVKILKF